VCAIFGKSIGTLLAYCIAGHHTGLPDGIGTQSALDYRLANADITDIAAIFKEALASVRPGPPPWKFDVPALNTSLWLRMLFSCLVDADRLDTERYMNPDQYNARQRYTSISELLKRFNHYMIDKTKKPVDDFDENLYNARQTVLDNCRAAAQNSPGFFSLTVPTGGGKTLSSMAFALTHAQKYGKQRVIYVIPYTSIIEQNANVFRKVFGDADIIEHHSNIDDEKMSERQKLSTENWDAPLIVTTSVQFFESLFTAQAGRARKLHNIANSVVILDEAQLVPSAFLAPILQTLDLLVRHYHVSIVICTATQPVFEAQKNFPTSPGIPAGSVREIITNVKGLYTALKRVNIEPPVLDAPAMEWEALAAQLTKEPQVLCVVSDRKSCRDLHKRMPKGTYHLSALMCAQHRSDIITEIKTKLAAGDTVRVISTQLVEAGVDIDFPVVFRALCGLDSIAQAAGRCNREGRLNRDRRLGRVVVFKTPRRPPTGTLRKAAETTEGFYKSGLENPLAPETFERYFAELYWKENSLDKEGIIDLLTFDRATGAIQFRAAGDAFKIIDDTKTKTIFVPYNKGKELLNDLDRISQLKNSNIAMMPTLRKLQRYAVSVYINQFNGLFHSNSLKEIIPDVFALNNIVEYDQTIGLLVDEPPNDPTVFIG
jgi:CRISPR-associated endonuclease/helicase Cas3